MRVGEVAERAEVNVETLRYYERRGLLPAPERTPSGIAATTRRRCASRRDQGGAGGGFTLAEIAEYLRAARRSGVPSEALRVRMAAKIDQIDGRIAACGACGTSSHASSVRLRLARSLHLRRATSPPRRGATARPSLLHITNGESAANAASDRLVAPCCVAGRAHEGPVRRCHGRSCCGRVRAFSPTAAGVAASAALIARAARPATARGAARQPRDRALVRARPLRQLQLLDVLALATPRRRAELIVIGSFGKPSFAGLGELTASELETLWPSRAGGTAALQMATSAGPPSGRSRRHWPSGRRGEEQLPLSPRCGGC